MKITAMSRRTRASVMITAAVAAVALAVTGCSGRGSSGDEAESKTLTMLTDNTAWKPQFDATTAEMGKTTGLTVKQLAVPDQNAYQALLNASLTTKPADIVKTSNGLQMQKTAASGELTDLTSVWDEAIAKGWLPESIRPYYTYKGKQYAVPMVGSYWLVFYNKKVFDQLGLTAPKTYAEFTSAAAKLKDAGVTPIYSAGADGWTSFIPWQTLAGSVADDYYDQVSQNKAPFNDENGVKVMTEWQKWIKKGWTTPFQTKMADAAASFAKGGIGMFPIGSWEVGAFKAAGMTAGTDYGSFVMPPMNDGGKFNVFFEGNGIGVPAKAPNHEGAMKSILEWLSPAAQTVWSNGIGDSSPNPQVSVSNPAIQESLDEIKATDATRLIRFFEAFPPDFVTNAIDQWSSFMVKPDDPKKSADDVQGFAEKSWAQWQSQTK